jgi:thiamine-phosphate pyrophosphorylase
LQNAAKQPIFCYVTDGSGFAPSERVRRVAQHVRAAVAGGANWVQIREKSLGTQELLRLTREVLQWVAKAGRDVRVVVNERTDIALAAGAGGVQLGGASAPAAEVVRWIRATSAGPHFVTGVSCHSVNDARAAEEAGANYVVFGPVYRTPSKLGFGAPHGTGRLADVCGAVKIPVIAIGGVDVHNARECFASGAAGVAAIRMFQEARDPEELRRQLARGGC